MPSHAFRMKVAASAALALACGFVHADFIVYSSPGDFAANAFMAATDSFDDLAAAPIASPTVRSVGTYSYSASATGSLYGSGPASDPWLSTDLSGDSITFTGFPDLVRGIGGYFFGSDVIGEFLAGQTIQLTALDSTGATALVTIVDATPASFSGFATNGSLVSLTVDILAAPAGGAFVTVNDLTLSQVPEPMTWSLMLLGIVAAGAATRRHTKPAGRWSD